MAYSVDVKVATGLTNTFTFAFSGLNHGFLSEDDIHVYVEDEPREYELLSESMLTVTGATIPAGSRVTIRRETPASMPVVDWIDGGQLNEQLLDNQTAQLLYLCQEALDGYAITDVWRDLNIHNYTIRGVGMDRTDPTSVATVGFFEEVAERAEHSEAITEQYKDAAHNSAVAAANSEGEASTSAELAHRWASEDEDVVVLDGKYSAYHHAQKAADEAAAAAYDAQRAEDAADRAEDTGGPATMDVMGIVHPDGSDSGLTITTPGKLKVTPATTTSRGIGRAATLADMEPDAEVTNGPAFIDATGGVITTTPTAHAVPQADAYGKLDAWVSLAGKANIDFNNITLTGKVNAGKAMAYALDYEHPVTFSILTDNWVYAPVGGLMVGWIWMDPESPNQSGVVTVGSTPAAGVAKGEGVSTISCIVDVGTKVKKAVGMHAEDIVIVPWRTV